VPTGRVVGLLSCGSAASAGTIRGPLGLLLKSPGVRYDVYTAAPQYDEGVAGDKLSNPGSPWRAPTVTWLGVAGA